MNFVFTSAGTKTNFDKLWLGDNQTYDVYVIYYDDDDTIYNRYKNNKYIKYIERRKGSKFQNFLYFYKKYPEIIEKYDRFFILDDDIVFKIDDINKMFNMSREYKLEICGPSFSESSKISWYITKHKKNTILTYTNFVEVNTMLMSKTAINKLMKVISPELIGWGIDILAMWANGLERKTAYAIIHSVICINPKDMYKGNIRELNKIKNASIRSTLYENHLLTMGIYNELKSFKMIEYKSIYFRYNEISNLYKKKYSIKWNYI